MDEVLEETIVPCKPLTVSLATFKKGVHYPKTLLPLTHTVHTVRTVRLQPPLGPKCGWLAFPLHPSKNMRFLWYLPGRSPPHP